MKLNKIVYDIREILNQYIDDSEIDNRHIIYLYDVKREKYIRQLLNNFQKSNDSLISQTLCLKVEEVSANECSLDIDCDTILRTVRPIPRPLELHNKPAISKVKPIKRLTIPFNFTNKERAIYSQFSPYNRSIFAFLDNDLHIYFVSNSEAINLLECITVTGVFTSPLDLKNYTNCCDCDPNENPCFDEENYDYPIPGHLIDVIRKEIVEEYMGKLQIPEDKNNNSDDA